MNHDEMVEIFGEVISSYPDSQACEDGILVPVDIQDRVTRACWDWLTANLPEGNAPPDRWPVEMMGWFQAETRDDKALAASKGLIGSHKQQATKVWEENIGGGVYMLYAGTKGEAITSLSAEENGASVVLWLIPNELGGVTLMFPEDY